MLEGGEPRGAETLRCRRDAAVRRPGRPQRVRLTMNVSDFTR